MKNRLYAWLTVVMIITMFAYQGCGLKPGTGIPAGITPAEVLAAIDRQTQNVKTFSGTASVKVLTNGSSETATVLIRYINPGLFRIYLKGFAGIDLGRISALADSVTVYVPPENIYLKAGRDEYILEKLFPEIDIDVQAVELLFNGTFLPKKDRKNFEMSMERIDGQLEMSLVNEDATFRYRVTGSDLRLIREEFLVNGNTILSKTLSGYKSFDGVIFPEEITVERGADSFSIHFSKCEINTGLTERDLTFAVPASAERVYIENSR
ncbi:DUF4292 domain-containing protein [Candidatus Latescibacterota bacterium]